MVTLQIIKSLRFGDLAVNCNFPIFSVVKPWRVSRNFTYTECVCKFTACFTEFFCFCVVLIRYLFISHV